jgi:putative spermidine/putrescine transport system substrate-binding protein
VVFNGVTIVYAKTRVQTSIRGWADFWRDDQRGKGLLIWVPFNSIGTAALLTAATINGGNEDNINPGFQALQRLRPFAAVQTA